MLHNLHAVTAETETRLIWYNIHWRDMSLYIATLQGVSKSGLMGFCDVAPGEPKVLLVQYTHGGVPYQVELAEKVSFIFGKHH